MRETTQDDLQYKNLHLLQNKRGYRSTEDSLILLYTIIKRLGFDFRGNAFEFGTGSGIISLLLAAKLKNITITAIEIQDSLFHLAKENIIHAGLENRVVLIKADGRKIKDFFNPGKFDCVFSNPPFFPKGSGKPSPVKEKHHARYEILCTMDDVLNSFEYLLKPQGFGFIVYPIQRINECVEKTERLSHLDITKISFFQDLKNPIGTWKSSQRKTDLSKFAQSSSLFVMEMIKRT
ncbi:MAG: methyltransferase [Candidatus Cloacimonetes bacterium]|nr:methyltransferase [Candidatus Cloacimonadota bacterium]